MHITDISSQPTARGGTRVEARVDGVPLWFACDDFPLATSAEAFASALLLPAAARRTPLEIDMPIDRAWFHAVQRLLRQTDAWWGLGETHVVPAGLRDSPRSTGGTTAQCFTGGVDSFFALINEPVAPGVLVFAHGYDIDLKDRRRLGAFLPGFRDTAAAFGSRPVVIATNLRRHPAVRRVSWRKIHGGALAALGHLLTPAIGRLVIPSSYPYHDPKPWGTHWDLDFLWSSAQLAVEHSDATLRRNGKIRSIANNPLVQRHLRVCWENRQPTGNCSACEKCVRTMLALENCGRLPDSTAFDQDIPLHDRITKLGYVSSHLISIYEELIKDCPVGETRAAVAKLIERSRRPWAKPALWFRKIGRSFLFR